VEGSHGRDGFVLQAGNLDGKSSKETWGEEPGTKEMRLTRKLLFFSSSQ